MGFLSNFSTLGLNEAGGGNFKEGTGWAVAAQAAPAIIGMFQANAAKNDYEQKITAIENYQRQEIVNPYENLQNPYQNLSVATQAAKMQAEQSDIALANTLDALRETGKAAGGATALAQAALKSKQNVSSTIEKQEVQNEKLKAQGQLQVDLYRGQGELNRMKMQETRDVSELDRLQGQADLAKAQQLAARRGTISALGKGLSTLSSGVLPDQIATSTATSESPIVSSSNSFNPLLDSVNASIFAANNSPNVSADSFINPNFVQSPSNSIGGFEEESQDTDNNNVINIESILNPLGN